ncbi:PAS domain-containing sensor histidine kinase [Cognatishimia sp. SS12]|uniref:sensor histidine kinase NtrY-like n=1 Tax=Cognatishimia sp. SS12 TaxID=2979465 RepID=UPI00232B3F90|nr:PAS domain-containing sensor histidine kinase [Cognatishimia sp. SS12]MDC0737117.1 PAS domain-containing sensor histidine kinase [Cognatishimia sp. SS12]
MTTRAKTTHWVRLRRLQRQRRVQNFATFGLVVLGPILALATFLVFGPMDQGASSVALRAILLADLVYVLLVAALVLQRIVRMISSRRAHSAGSRLHMRLTGAFALMALLPAVTMAIFAGLTINIGLEGWFSDRVSNVIGNSVAAAEAYEAEHVRGLEEDAIAIARFINARRASSGTVIGAGEFREMLSQAQPQIQRGLREAFVVDGGGALRARGDRSYLFDFEQPTPEQIEAAREDGITFMRDLEQNELRALLPLTAYVDRFLYVSREVDGAIFSLLDETQESAQLYAQLENERGEVLIRFGLIYMGFAVILILAATWLGLWFAERLSRPVGRLTGAAQLVGAGDLDVQVVEEEGDDEIAMLGRYFNQMTKQLKLQRQTLMENTEQIESRRRLFDSVLGSVTSGVLGLDVTGRITFYNRSAEKLLGIMDEQTQMPLGVAIPEFDALFTEVTSSGAEVAQEEIKVVRDGQLESLLVRIATRRSEEGTLEGYVLAFDEVTDLVTAQRMAAWGDVARRIAHEIKNPLTPIQLSAERIKRKFAPQVGEDREKLEQMTGVIVRQTNDLRRIVDEFSKFARMPEPERREVNIAQLLKDAVLLQESGQPNVRFSTDIADTPIFAHADDTMLNQALTNLIKNAGEATESLASKGTVPDLVPEIRVTLTHEGKNCRIQIADNGIGLPEDRARLFEPYVTTRDKGTGLGLPIVKKIIEEHGGSLALLDAPVFDGNSHFGAMAEIVLPVMSAASGDDALIKLGDETDG